MAHETHVDIAAPADRVWATMIDVERWPQWTRSMSSVERLDDGPFGPGSRVRAKQPRMPAATWTVAEFEAGRRFTWTASGPGFTTTGEHELTTLADGRVRVRLAVTERGPMAALVGRVLGRLTREYVELEAQGLKRECEAAGR